MYLATHANRKYENKTGNLVSIWIATKTSRLFITRYIGLKTRKRKYFQSIMNNSDFILPVILQNF